MPETAAVPCAGKIERLAHLQGTGRCPARAFKEANGAPNPRYHVQSGRTEDHLRGASPFPDAMRSIVEKAGCPTLRLPVVEKIEVRDRTRAG